MEGGREEGEEKEEEERERARESWLVGWWLVHSTRSRSWELSLGLHIGGRNQATSSISGAFQVRTEKEFGQGTTLASQAVPELLCQVPTLSWSSGLWDTQVLSCFP